MLITWALAPTLATSASLLTINISPALWSNICGVTEGSTQRLPRDILCRRLLFDFFFFFRWRYSPLWALACRTIPLHLSLSITNSLHLLTPSTWRSLSTSSLHPFLGLPLRLVPSISWVKIFLGILSSCILSRWPSQLILCPFIHFTIFSPLLKSSSSRFVLPFHSPSSYLGPYILLNIFL